MSHKLIELGWSTHFMMQLQDDELQTLPVARVTQVHRNQMIGIGHQGEFTLSVPGHGSTGDYAVGDWVVYDAHAQVVRALDRLTLVERRAAGEDARAQLIAANLDVLFITTSCNKDFNIARLERYLAVAQRAGIQPVVLLTKADLVDDTYAFEAEVQKIDPLLPVIALDTRDPKQMLRCLTGGRLGKLQHWWALPVLASQQSSTASAVLPPRLLAFARMMRKAGILRRLAASILLAMGAG